MPSVDQPDHDPPYPSSLIWHPVPNLDQTREGWLLQAGALLRPAFKDFKLEQFRVSCGWPCQSALSLTKRRIGECHYAKSSKDGHHEIFVSPCLDNPEDVLGTLAHEMAHVAAGPDAKHGPAYKRVCLHVGLTKGKATEAGPGPEMMPLINDIMARLGPYPHAALEPIRKPKESKITQLPVKCPDCGCRWQMGVKWLEASGLPTCGCGTPMQLAVIGGE